MVIMDSTSTYSLLLLFYALLGAVIGTAHALSARRSNGTYHLPTYQAVPVLLGLAAFFYMLLGLGEMRGRGPLYAYLPIFLMWWAGTSLGRTIVPRDWQMAGFPLAFFILAVLIYHLGL